MAVGMMMSAKQEKCFESFRVCGREHEFCRFSGEIRKYSAGKHIHLLIVHALPEKMAVAFIVLECGSGVRVNLRLLRGNCFIKTVC